MSKVTSPMNNPYGKTVPIKGETGGVYNVNPSPTYGIDKPGNTDVPQQFYAAHGGKNPNMKVDMGASKVKTPMNSNISKG